MADPVLWVLFLVASTALVALALLALLTLGSVRLHSILGVLRDGPALGSSVPAFRGTSAAGLPVELPTRGRWQLVLFAHEGLKEFPEIMEAVAEFAEVGAGEVVWLSRVTDVDGRAAALALRLPVAPTFVDGRVYRQYNVRAIPFVLVIDDAGTVRGRGLVNHRDTLFAIWERARAEVTIGHAAVSA